MKCEAVGLDHLARWDEIVKSFSQYDVYYLSDYVKAFYAHGDGEPLLLYFYSKSTRAINVVMKRDLSQCKSFTGKIEKAQYFDFVTPYGYGGFLIEGNDVSELNKAYCAYCEENNIICEFVRFHPVLENARRAEPLYEICRLGKTVCIKLENEEQIWNDFSSKNRNMIRKAQKNALKTYWCREPEIIDIFMEIYKETMDLDSASEYYYFKRNFYESILEDLKDNAMWFYVKKDNQIVSIAIFMYCNGNMHYHLSASKKEFRSLAPSNLLLYEAARWGLRHGCKYLHLGGGVGSKEDSLYDFKKSFNKNKDEEFYIGKKIFSPQKYEKMIELREMVGCLNKDSSFFPLYRA